MAVEHCTVNNTKFQSIENPFIKLFELLPQLQYGLLENGQYSYKLDTSTLTAIHQSAEQSVEEILMNLPSLGTLLATAADNTEMGLLPQDINQIGWLLNSLSHILIACHKVKEGTAYELSKRKVLI